MKHPRPSFFITFHKSETDCKVCFSHFSEEDKKTPPIPAVTPISFQLPPPQRKKSKKKQAIQEEDEFESDDDDFWGSKPKSKEGTGLSSKFKELLDKPPTPPVSAISS